MAKDLSTLSENVSARLQDFGARILLEAETRSLTNIGKDVTEHAEEYEKEFLDSLMNFIKNDEVLQHFYLRLIYECEIVQIVLKVRKNTDLMELKDIIEDMKSAEDTKQLAKADASFHRRLFSIAGEVEFYNWYELQAKSLNKFLQGFWSYIGYKTPYYESLLKIHSDIYEAIEKKDKVLAKKSTLEHFSILLFQLLSVTFQRS